MKSLGIANNPNPNINNAVRLNFGHFLQWKAHLQKIHQGARVRFLSTSLHPLGLQKHRTWWKPPTQIDDIDSKL